MSAKALAAAVSITFLAACQPEGRIAPLPVAEVPAAPAEEALAASCTGDPALSAQMVEAVNAARTAEGKTVLDPDAGLERIAQSHACDMAAMGQATVAGSNGSNVVDRARAAGYPTCGVVQLVSTGGTPLGTVNGWLASMPHRDEVLGQPSDQIGAGVTRGADGRLWYSVVLGERC